MNQDQKEVKLKELEEIKDKLVAISNELLMISDRHVYTALHLNEAKNALTRVQREISSWN